MKTIATGNGFSIGCQEGIAMQTDTQGEWMEAHEECPFTDTEGQEYRCYDGEWVKTDEAGNAQ